MDDISVVICTYNGAKYIEEQLESIRKQSIPAREIIVCDDNSSDDTIQCVADYKKKHQEINIRILVQETNVGVIKNFEFGLTEANSKYIALSDQDDIWLEKKLEMTLKRMKALETLYGDHLPLLVHTDLLVVNDALDMINSSFIKMKGLQCSHIDNDLKSLFLQNYVTGCTILINRVARDNAVPFPNNIIMHDWWIALVVAGLGKIDFLNEVTIKYRQHGENVVGAKRYISLRSFRGLFKKNNMEQSICATIKQNNELVNHKSKIILLKNAWLLNALEELKGYNAMSLFKLGIYKQGKLRTYMLYIFCVVKKILKW